MGLEQPIDSVRSEFAPRIFLDRRAIAIPLYSAARRDSSGRYRPRVMHFNAPRFIAIAERFVYARVRARRVAEQ